MIATTTKAMNYWHPVFEDNINIMVRNLDASKGDMSEDIVHHLRVTILLNSQAVMAGSQAKLKPGDFPHIVGEYNSLVVWRLCLPDWVFEWLKLTPFSHAKFRVKSSELLFKLGENIVKEAEKADPSDRDEVPTKPPHMLWPSSSMSWPLAVARNTSLQESVYNELATTADNDDLEDLKLLVVPKGGVDILGYYMPEGTVVTTQPLSMSRQRPDHFPDYDLFDPTRWLEEDQLAERRRLTAPFGVGARRCPGGNMATYQMRLIIAAVLREFKVSVAPETTPESMTSFEANGFRSRYDQCFLILTPRDQIPLLIRRLQI
ncbi:hypothetical protein diail_8084 [Diaporthe ilicicola]|nr:hypothetical protein diail_8084 [Diaporthe ilicicola]